MQIAAVEYDATTRLRVTDDEFALLKIFGNLDAIRCAERERGQQRDDHRWNASRWPSCESSSLPSFQARCPFTHVAAMVLRNV